MGDGNLSELFTVSEDAKFGFSGEYFAPANDGCLAGAVSEPVIREYLCRCLALRYSIFLVIMICCNPYIIVVIHPDFV